MPEALTKSLLGSTELRRVSSRLSIESRIGLRKNDSTPKVSRLESDTANAGTGSPAQVN